MQRTTRFRLLIEAPEILVLPGVHDALSLRIAEQAGFSAVSCGGYSATAGLLGQPDVAQLTMTEMGTGGDGREDGDDVVLCSPEGIVSKAVLSGHDSAASRQSELCRYRTNAES